jgi:hypothetical protein
MVGDTTRKLAVLIDADNARFSIINLLLAEIAKNGTAQVKRAYGDWSNCSLKGWKDELLQQSIQPIQQFAYTHGKNATHSAMIIVRKVRELTHQYHISLSSAERTI